jgi:hypothetical protein
MLNFKTIPKIDGITAGNLVRNSNSKPTVKHKLAPIYPKPSELFWGGGGEREQNVGGMRVIPGGGGGDDVTVKIRPSMKIATTRYYTLIERQNELYSSVFATQNKILYYNGIFLLNIHDMQGLRTSTAGNYFFGIYTIG